MKQNIRVLTSLTRLITIRGLSQIQLDQNQFLSTRLLQHVQNLNEMKIEKSSIIKNFQEINKLHHLPRYETYEEVNNIDRKNIKIQELSPDAILRMLCSYTSIHPGRIHRYCFYNESLNQLTGNLNYLDVKQVIQLIYFIGLKKNTGGAQSLLKKCLRRFSSEDIQSFNIEDLCVICNATYKTVTPILRFEILENIIDTINNNLRILEDEAVFVTFMKTIRQNHYLNEELLNTISHTILFNSTYKKYSFASLCHILASYSDFFYYDEALLNLFYVKCRDFLCADDKVLKMGYGHASNTIRAKDITRFLWIYSSLGHTLSHDFLAQVLEPSIVARYEAGWYDRSPEVMLDSIFYMWMMNYHAKEAIALCFNESYIGMINDSKSKGKHRMKILVTCMQLENLALYKKLPIHQIGSHNYNMTHQISSRPTLNAVFNALNSMAPVAGIDEFKFECQVPFLNIVGITGYNKKIYKVVFIEVLDEFVYLRNKEDLQGSMQLKLRLLERKEQNVITVTAEDVKTQTLSELKEDLLKELKTLCRVN